MTAAGFPRAAEVHESPTLLADYFGEPLPGDLPVMIAPGIVSTDLHDDWPPLFTSDGSEVILRTVANEPGVVLGAAGVEVRNQALLLMQFFQIRNSALSGLSVRTGARAAARFGMMASTHNDVDARFGGLNAVAAEGSTLDLSRFTLTRGSLAGIYVAKAYASSHTGVISYHPIGAAVFPETDAPLFPPEDVVQCVLDSNAFVGNERTFDGPILPVPCSGDACPVPACPVVPFVCEWCE